MWIRQEFSKDKLVSDQLDLQRDRVKVDTVTKVRVGDRNQVPHERRLPFRLVLFYLNQHCYLSINPGIYNKSGLGKIVAY